MNRSSVELSARRRPALLPLIAVLGCSAEPPIPTNQPPFVIQGSWQPPTPYVFSTDAGCAARFAITVSDPDPSDSIVSASWYLDGVFLRPTPGPLKLPGDVYLTLSAQDFSASAVHTVSVRVTDTTFFSDGGVAPRIVQDVSVPGGLVRFDWTVSRADSGC